MIFNSLEINSWIILGISASVLVCVVVFLTMCVCMKCKDKSFCNLQLFTRYPDPKLVSSDSTGIQEQYGFFRKFSVLSDCNPRISTGKLKTYKSSNVANFQESLSDNELLDSFDNSNSFDNTVLEIDNMDKYNIDTPEESDETLSCSSYDSKFTAYSTFTLARASSFADTVKSALSWTTNRS